MTNPELERLARARVARAAKEIQRSVSCIDEGNPLAAEWDLERLRDRLKTKALLSQNEAESIALGMRAYDRASKKERASLAPGGPEAIWGRTIDFVGAAFLERGFVAARSVARVAYRDGRARGTGFMVSDRLFLTNHHVIESAADAGQFCAEFDYELDPRDQQRAVTRFAFDDQAFFLSDPVTGLDYTLIAIGQPLSGTRPLPEFGWCSLSAASDKHALGEVANIVQHPDGRYKEVVLRENQFVARLDYVLHYLADTQGGSSGSPVFNNEWRVIALHHWGGPWRQKVDDHGRPLSQDINEGIRASAIVSHLREGASGLAAPKRALLEQVLALGEGQVQPPLPGNRALDGNHSARMDGDGRVTWRIPIELSVRIPGLGDLPPSAPPAAPVNATSALGEAKVKPSKDYSDRSGYKPRFLQGFTIDLPDLTAAQKQDAARNQEAGAGDDPYELKYHHFSVVINKERRLAFFTACNIDGSKSKHVDRKSGSVTVLEPDDRNLESLDAEGAEASETWYDDERIGESEYAGRDIYEKQVVPGYLDTTSMARTYRMFQRGHLVRRMDPAWGSTKQALEADADTFHWTNCSPQVGFFNMGRASSNTPNSGHGKLWRALENYVLRNAVTENQRVTCFTGPIFGSQDRDFRGIKVPGRFWKVVVWSEQGQLRSIAMIADQRPVTKVWPEGIGGGAAAGTPEAYGDPSEIEKVEDFLTTVEEIEHLTKLGFGEDVRGADLHAAGGGEKMKKVTGFGEIPVTKRGRNGGSGKPRGKAKANGKGNENGKTARPNQSGAVKRRATAANRRRKAVSAKEE